MNIILGITDVFTKAIKLVRKESRFYAFSVAYVIVIWAQLFLKETKGLDMTWLFSFKDGGIN